jgi:hypothetical protein
MQDTTMLGRTLDAVGVQSHTSTHAEPEKTEVVSTHVLVEQDKVDALRELSRRTRIAQSEYLREAVDDLLNKYEKKEQP